MSDRIPTYRVDRGDIPDTPASFGEFIAKSISYLLIMATICVMGTAFSAVLLGMFIRITYWVLNYRW